MALGHIKRSKLGILGLLLVVLLVLAASPLPADFDCDGQTSVGVDECQALVALYNGTGGASWTNSSGWLQAADVCTWYGVACSQGHIVSLDLNNNNLSGNLPIEIGGFPYLKTLTLNDNPLTGPVPVTVTFMNLDLFHFQGTSLCEPVDPGFQDWFSQIVYRFSSGIYCSILEPTGTLDPNATELPWPQQTLTALAEDAQKTSGAPFFATTTPEATPTRVSGISTQSDFYSSDFGEGMGSFGGTGETGTKPAAAPKNERSGFLSNIPTGWLALLTVPVGLIVLGVVLELRERKQAQAPANSDTSINLDERLGSNDKKKKDQDKDDDSDNFGDFDMYDFGGN